MYLVRSIFVSVGASLDSNWFNQIVGIDKFDNVEPENKILAIRS